MRSVFVALLLAGASCRGVAERRDMPPEPGAASGERVALDASAPARASVAATPVGPPVDAEIPLFGGGSLSLSSLRGRVVLLELASAASPTWLPDQERWRSLLGELGAGALVVVVVSADVSASAAERHWNRDPSPFVLAWDPEGALALRLGVTRWPTRFVLDREGRVLITETGTGEAALARIEQALRAASNA